MILLIRITSTLFLIVLLLLEMQGCSTRNETPVTDEDSTISYLPKQKNGILAKITFYGRVNKKADKYIGARAVFTIKDKAKIYALIELKNRFYFYDRELMFHIDWIGPNSKSFYRKRLDLLPDDSSSTIKSSISISPKKRQPGNYKLRIYLFRELIAEKNFELRAETPVAEDSTLKDLIKVNLTLYSKASRKTGNLIGEGTVFIIKNKAKVRALVNVEKPEILRDRKLTFYIDWIGVNGKSFYRKRVDLLPEDSSSTIKSSISIPPAKRKPGTYIIRVFLFHEIIAEKKFELHSESHKFK